MVDRISNIRRRRNSYMYERYHELATVKKHLEINQSEIKGQLNGLVAFNNLNDIQQALINGLTHVLNDITDAQFDVLFLASAVRGDFQALNLLLNRTSPMSPTLPDIQYRKLNALHLAIIFGHSACVEAFLVNEDLRYLWLSTNYQGYWPLHLAMFYKCAESVEVILNYIRHELEINKCSTIHPYVAPLHIAAMLDFSAGAKILLENGADSEVILRTESYTPLHLAALYDNTLTAEVLLLMGANLKATTPEGMSALSLVEIHVPKALNSMLDSCIKLENSKEYRIVTIDTKVLMEEHDCLRTSLLSYFASSNSVDCLRHPVCRIVVDDKWAKIRKWFTPHFVVSLLLLLCTTITILAFRTCQCTLPDLSNFSSSLRCKNKGCSVIFPSNNQFAMVIVQLARAISIPLLFYQIVRKLVGIFVLSKEPTVLRKILIHFKTFHNVSDWLCMILFLCVILTDPQDTPFFQEISPFIVLLSWFNIASLLEKLPWFGTYISMFDIVMKEYLTVLTAYFWLFIGYAVTFFIIFQNKSQFMNPLTALTRILVMMAGEYDYNDLFTTKNVTTANVTITSNLTRNSNLSNNLSVVTVQIIFISFILSMPIILTNLLIGIVVHDVTEIKKNAKIATLCRTINLVEHLELFSETVLSIFGANRGSCCPMEGRSDDFLIVKRVSCEARTKNEALQEAVVIALHNSAYGT